MKTKIETCRTTLDLTGHEVSVAITELQIEHTKFSISFLFCVDFSALLDIASSPSTFLTGGVLCVLIFVLMREFWNKIMEFFHKMSFNCCNIFLYSIYKYLNNFGLQITRE